MAESNRVRELIAERNESFAVVATRAGISEKTLRNVASGRPSNRSTRRLIAQALATTETAIWPGSFNYARNTPGDTHA
jgi:lambda repressor-like predicted transcriptional regulator